MRKFEISFDAQLDPMTANKPDTIAASIAKIITDTFQKYQIQPSHKIKITILGVSNAIVNVPFLYRFVDFTRPSSSKARSYDSFISVTNFALYNSLYRTGDALLPMKRSIIRIKYYA